MNTTRLKVPLYQLSIYNSPLDLTTRRVLLTLTKYLMRDGEREFPSMHHLSQATGISEAMIGVYLNTAAEAGYLIKDDQGSYAMPDTGPIAAFQ